MPVKPEQRFRRCIAVRQAESYNRPMSEAIAFDSHRFVKRLTENGFTEAQAEVLADEQITLLNANLATRQNIADVQKEMTDIRKEIVDIRKDIEVLRQETRADIERLKSDLLKWMFGALIAQGGLVVALIKLL